MDNNLQEKIYRLVDILSKWENDQSSIYINELNKCYYDFTFLLLKQNHSNIPNNLPSFIRFLNENKLKVFGNGEEECERSLLNENLLLDGKLNPKIKFWYHDIKSIKELEQKAMLEFLLACRKYRGTENEVKYGDFYREGRSLVNKDNNIVTNLEFKILITKKFPKELRDIINKWRKDIYLTSEQITVCPICGKMIDNSFGNENLCSDICQYYITKNKMNLKKVNIDTTKQYSEFTSGIYRYILLPNIGEKIIYNNLVQYSGIDVELSPNMDEYDIKIETYGEVINIDVKDVSSPDILVGLLKENNGIKKLLRSKNERRYLVVPNHRKYIFNKKENRDYKKTLNNIFYNDGIDIEVIYEKELYKEIEKIL